MAQQEGDGDFLGAIGNFLRGVRNPVTGKWDPIAVVDQQSRDKNRALGDLIFEQAETERKTAQIAKVKTITDMFNNAHSQTQSWALSNELGGGGSPDREAGRPATPGDPFIDALRKAANQRIAQGRQGGDSVAANTGLGHEAILALSPEQQGQLIGNTGQANLTRGTQAQQAGLTRETDRLRQVRGEDVQRRLTSFKTDEALREHREKAKADLANGGDPVVTVQQGFDAGAFASDPELAQRAEVVLRSRDRAAAKTFTTEWLQQPFKAESGKSTPNASSALEATLADPSAPQWAKDMATSYSKLPDDNPWKQAAAKQIIEKAGQGTGEGADRRTTAEKAYDAYMEAVASGNKLKIAVTKRQLRKVGSSGTPVVIQTANGETIMGGADDVLRYGTAAGREKAVTQARAAQETVSLIQELRGIAATDKTAFGAAGNIQGTIQNAAAQSQALQQLVGTMQGDLEAGDMDPEVAAAVEEAVGDFNENIPRARSLEVAIAYAVAKMNDPGGRVARDDFEYSLQEITGANRGTSWLANARSMDAALAQVEKRAQRTYEKAASASQPQQDELDAALEGNTPKRKKLGKKKKQGLPDVTKMTDEELRKLAGQ